MSSVNAPAASTLLDHPRILYLREAGLLPHPDGWLSGLFDPANEEERFRVVLVCSWPRPVVPAGRSARGWRGRPGRVALG